MGLFLHEVTSISDEPRRRVSALAVISLAVAATGFLTAIGFVLGAVIAHAALIRIRMRRDSTPLRGRRLAIAGLWLSYSALLMGATALVVVLLIAYAALPAPPSLF